MDSKEFQRILTCFADKPADVDVSKGTLLVQLRDQVISAKVTSRPSGLIVEEDGVQYRSEDWIINRIAQLHLLADRILSYIPEQKDFVTPAGALRDQLDFEDNAQSHHGPDATKIIYNILNRRPGGTSSVLYLTSDAGEGKTTLINHVARAQAQAYKSKSTDWLLIPISLGGRAFLRFDDIVVAALVNTLRFQGLYYEAFVELVKLGALVPAFDGFEEMFVGNTSDDAVSALGNMLQLLNSSGSLLLSARKAYFEYRGLDSPALLYDALGVVSVSFARLSLERWTQAEFMQYAANRGIAAAEQIYSDFSTKIGATHPLLTRAVLVQKLFDVASVERDRQELLTRIQREGEQWFMQFVDALIEREANKWIDSSGSPARPLIAASEHHELLCMVAQEMWESGTSSLRGDVLDALTEIYCDKAKKPAAIGKQLKERLKQHALLTQQDLAKATFTFDHEEFNHFFLGESIGRCLLDGSLPDMRRLMQPRMLPERALDVAALYIRSKGGALTKPISSLADLTRTEDAASFVSENAGSIAIRILIII
jgi:hypothetical protein